jgi:hypothetical protein
MPESSAQQAELLPAAGISDPVCYGAGSMSMGMMSQQPKGPSSQHAIVV